jgi:hypothetical protein
MSTSIVKRVVLCLAVTSLSLQASSVLVGNPPLIDTGNCDPFGCPHTFGLVTYEQVYLASAFPGPMNIYGLTFFDGQVLNGGQEGSGNFSVSLSYTPVAPGALNLTTPTANVGSDSQTFFGGALPALVQEPTGQELIIPETPTLTPFAYNPADGNLLLTVTVSGTVANGSPALFLNQSACGPKTGCRSGGTSVVSGYAYYGTLNGAPVSGGNDFGGLVTEFDYASPVPTPEPASWPLALGGMVILAYWTYRRRTI